MSAIGSDWLANDVADREREEWRPAGPAAMAKAHLDAAVKAARPGLDLGPVFAARRAAAVSVSTEDAERQRRIEQAGIHTEGLLRNSPEAVEAELAKSRPERTGPVFQDEVLASRLYGPRPAAAPAKAPADVSRTLAAMLYRSR